MTSTNGHPIASTILASELPDSPIDVDDNLPTLPVPVDAEVAEAGRRSEIKPAHTAVPERVEKLRAAVEQARAIVAIQDDPALQQELSQKELARDRKVAEKIRAAQRKQRRKAGLEEVRGAGRERRDARWSGRARRARERLLNPDRRLASTYRRYVLLSAIPVGLIIIGVVWMAGIVHDGVVGTDGPWTGYLVGPLASVLLIVSMATQFTAVEHGHKNPKWFLWLDGGLLVADLVLGIVPWSLRYGWAAEDVLGHALPPLLIVAAVVVHHVIVAIFSSIFESIHDELDETGRLDENAADVLVLVERTRKAMNEGRLVPDEHVRHRPSTEATRRFFNIAKKRAQLASDGLDLLKQQQLI